VLLALLTVDRRLVLIKRDGVSFRFLRDPLERGRGC
jgi:hypothetical protein